MKDQYDFTGAERGKFYRKNVIGMIPVHLEIRVSSRLANLAHRKDVTVSELLDYMLKREEDEDAAAAAR